MTKEEKVQLVNLLTDEFKSSDAIVVCNYKGLNVKSIEVLRIAARTANVKVQVIKNTLADIAMKNAQIEDLGLKDTNIFIWGEDQLSVSKVVTNFIKAIDKESFVVKSAFVGNEKVDASRIEELAKMPSRNELLAMLLQVWNAPITNFTIGLDALRAKKEQSA
ncbi:MAG: 50S ribosomal protein L10 [Campylobacteraceae bacterium]|nr:50S ribosomal protein L10 [Campylobacteraceae bacterium]